MLIHRNFQSGNNKGLVDPQGNNRGANRQYYGQSNRQSNRQYANIGNTNAQQLVFSHGQIIIIIIIIIIICRGQI